MLLNYDHVRVLVTQTCPTLCNPMDCSPPGSSVHGISQARILEQVAISFSRGSSLIRGQTCVSCVGRQIIYHWAIREALISFPAAAAAAAKSCQSCLTLCDPRDSSPPGSPIPGILQARVLEWVAIAFSVFLSYLLVNYFLAFQRYLL